MLLVLCEAWVRAGFGLAYYKFVLRIVVPVVRRGDGVNCYLTDDWPVCLASGPFVPCFACCHIWSGFVHAV